MKCLKTAFSPRDWRMFMGKMLLIKNFLCLWKNNKPVEQFIDSSILYFVFHKAKHYCRSIAYQGSQIWYRPGKQKPGK